MFDISCLKKINRQFRFYLALYIKRRREEQGISIAELTEHLSLSKEDYVRIESARKKITEGCFLQLASFLNFKDEELSEIVQISEVAYMNDLAKIIFENYPQ